MLYKIAQTSFCILICKIAEYVTCNLVFSQLVHTEYHKYLWQITLHHVERKRWHYILASNFVKCWRF